MAGITSGISSLLGSGSFTIEEKPAKITIAELDDNFSPLEGKQLPFFPETITEEHSIEYNQKQVWGGSHPLYQWTTCGERTISFTVFLYREEFAEKSLENFDRLGQEESIYNVDIVACLSWLKSLKVPKYDGGGQIKSPPVLLVTFPELRLGHVTKGGVGTVDKGKFIPFPGSKETINSGLGDYLLSILTQMSIEYRAFFPSGVPRLATANLTLTEIVQWNTGIKFVGRTVYEKASEKYIGNFEKNLSGNKGWLDKLKSKI